MRARLQSYWRDLLDSLWFTPSVIAALYVIVALLLLRADTALGLQTQGRDAWAVGGADGARGVLFAIAGTTLSVLSVVFSLTVVVLQIASAQFTPRVMRTLTGDRGTQVVLGVFFGAFTYALVVWRLDRLGRSLQHLIAVVAALAERGIGFKSLTEQIDTTTSGGKLIFHVFGALAEFERCRRPSVPLRASGKGGLEEEAIVDVVTPRRIWSRLPAFQVRLWDVGSRR